MRNAPAAQLEEIERYYDEVPRAFTTTEDIGPFTLFVRRDPAGWPYYARPRLGHQGGVTADDVRRVRARQRELGIPESFEWVAQTTPAVAEAARATGLRVTEHPLLVLGPRQTPADPPAGVRVEVLEAGSPLLGTVNAAVGAGFSDTDEATDPGPTEWAREPLAAGLLRMVAAFDGTGVVGGGSHAPRRGVTELTGIAVLPRARSRGVGAALTAALVADARDLGVRTVFLSAGTERVARIYERVGFERVATACIAETTA